MFGASLGIAGPGRIGRAVATRLQGFDTHIHYYSRTRKENPGWTCHDDLGVLAKAFDVLVVAVFGGPDTVQIITKEINNVLGIDRLLVNVARGSTVDQDAQINSLKSKTMRGFASDMFVNEPNIDKRFI